MKNEIVKLPEEVLVIADQCSEEKKQEVGVILNQIFAGTADWESQVDSIEVKDINDTMSIQLADTARKNAKNARIAAEKKFDKKRDALKLKMQDDKLEDSLWLKSKQIMQIKFKHIEEKAKFKADFVKRYEEEQLNLRNELRLSQVLKYIDQDQVPTWDINSMSDDVFKVYIAGVEKDFNDKIEAEKKAEEERIAKEKEAEDERKRIEAENERLKKEAEEAAKEVEIEREKQRKEREAEAEKLRVAQEEKAKLEREEKEKRDKIQAELDAKIESENKAKADEAARIEAELSKDDADKIQDLINDLEGLKTKYSFKSRLNQKKYNDVGLLIDKVINHVIK